VAELVYLVQPGNFLLQGIHLAETVRLDSLLQLEDRVFLVLQGNPLLVEELV
jgi:hypothetical protein